MNRTSSAGNGRGGTAYLGKDILGSVRSVTNETGQLEDRYEYDAFGKPYQGDLDNGMNLGYMAKPYDSNTGLYNYGYRDYKPEAARFTTVDPIRDGSNWFVYVNNDPVNYVDLWGLEWEITTPYQGAAGVEGARNDHLGNDWVYRDSEGNNVTTGQPVNSYTGGTVITGTDDDLGNYVRVEGDDGSRTDYFHLDTTTVTNGATVQAGDQIGTAGNTGLSSGPHLHVAQSFPRDEAPEGTEVYNPDNVWRSYVAPPATVPGPGIVSINNNTQGNKND